MALGYLIDPAFQSVNENGRPLVGGHIEVFYHNSQLPYITKSDFDGTNNPFKVPLNSKGMAVLIADDSNAYDVFCYDAFNALFWSRDNVVIGGSGSGITGIVFFDYETATYDDIRLADGLGKLIVLKERINTFNVAYAQMQYSVPLGSYVFTNIYNNNLTTYTIALDGTKTKQTIPIGGGSSGVEFIGFSTTFAQVGAILTDGKWPILVEETTPDSPNYYYLVNNNGGTEYIFGNISGTLNKTYKLSGGGWTSNADISFENSSNKVTSWSSTPSDIKYPSEKLVFNKFANIDNKIKFDQILLKSYAKYDPYLDQSYKTRIWGYSQNGIYFISGAFRLYANPNLLYEASDGCGLASWPALFYIDLPADIAESTSSFAIFSNSSIAIDELYYVRIGANAGERRIAIAFNKNVFDDIEIDPNGTWFNVTCGFIRAITQ